MLVKICWCFGPCINQALYKTFFHFQITFLDFTAVLDFEKHLSSCKVSRSWQFHKISPQYPISCSNRVSYCQIWMTPLFSNQPTMFFFSILRPGMPSKRWPNIEGYVEHCKRLGKVTHYVSRLLSEGGQNLQSSVRH